MTRRYMPTIQARYRNIEYRLIKFLCVLHSFLDTTPKSHGFYCRRKESPLRLMKRCLTHLTQQSALHKGTRIFVVDLEAALRTLHGCLPRRPPADHNSPIEAIYADDIDLILIDHDYLRKVNEIAQTALGDWFLYAIANQTERTNTNRKIDRVAEEWRTTKKVGSLLGDIEDLSSPKNDFNILKVWPNWLQNLGGYTCQTISNW